jgi:hypothetical protein
MNSENAWPGIVRICLRAEPLREDGKTKSGMLVFAWYVFEKGYSGAPHLGWIDNGADLF